MKPAKRLTERNGNMKYKEITQDSWSVCHDNRVQPFGTLDLLDDGNFYFFPIHDQFGCSRDCLIEIAAKLKELNSAFEAAANG